MSKRVLNEEMTQRLRPWIEYEVTPKQIRAVLWAMRAAGVTTAEFTALMKDKEII